MRDTAIPAHRAYPDGIDNERNIGARLWGGCMEWRAVATREKRRAASVTGIPCILTALE